MNPRRVVLHAVSFLLSWGIMGHGYAGFPVAEIYVIFQSDPVNPAPHQTEETFAKASREIEVSTVGVTTLYVAITSDLDGVEGVHGWALSLPVDGGVVPVFATLDGTVWDVPPEGIGSPLSFHRSDVVDPENNAGQHGVVAAMVYADGPQIRLDPIGTATTLAIGVEVVDRLTSGTIRCMDGLVGEGQPVENVFSVAGMPRGYRECRGATLRPVAVAALPFRRGDANDDARIDIADAVSIFRALYVEGFKPRCRSALDVNDDALINLTDGVVLLRHLFLDGAPPAAPFLTCGPDPSRDFPCEEASEGCA